MGGAVFEVNWEEPSSTDDDGTRRLVEDLSHQIAARYEDTLFHLHSKNEQQSGSSEEHVVLVEKFVGLDEKFNAVLAKQSDLGAKNDMMLAVNIIAIVVAVIAVVIAKRATTKFKPQTAI